MDWPTVADLVDTGPWYHNRGVVLLNCCLFLAIITSYTNGFDGSMTGGLQLIPQWQDYFHNPEGSTLGFMTSAQNIGALLALPFAPFLSDGFGRRKGLLVGSCIMLGGVALQTQSTSIEQFILSRGLIGFGLGFATNAAPLLITELAYPTQRAPITASYNSSWYLGSIVAAWTTFGTFRMTGTTWSWRIPSLLQALPSILQLTLVWFIPESPRYLVSKGRDQEAKEILGKYHGNGNINHPLADYEFNEIKEALLMEKELSKPSYIQLFATKGNRRRMRVIIALGFFSQWSGNGLVSYYINLVLETAGIQETSLKTLINAVLQLFNFFMAIGSAAFVDRIGRRTLFLVSNCGMLVAFGLWTMLSALREQTGSKVAGQATVGIIFLYYGFYDIAYSPLLVAYTVEILPFNVRAKGFAVMNFTVSIALIFNQYVNPVALKKLGWKYYLFYCGWLAFELIFVYFFLWETKGRTLEQTAALFDGDGSDSALQELGAERIQHRSLTSNSDENLYYHRSQLSARSEKYNGEHFEMSPVTRPRYDWDRVHEQRARRESQFHKRDSQMVVEQNRHRREHQRRESRIHELVESISDPYTAPTRVNLSRSPTYPDPAYGRDSPASPTRKEPPHYFP
ncbi:hypothetical protein FRB94_014147 [Tulasnella sp. JGI-2019a]|nr:hypothetical protein FRB93_008428 [Tulasnella sp. JGI-2019a]KAG9007629.1 hypothetical protein FRB94_014147 [Tulasnella sp. JGI-2019a]